MWNITNGKGGERGGLKVGSVEKVENGPKGWRIRERGYYQK